MRFETLSNSEAGLSTTSQYVLTEQIMKLGFIGTGAISEAIILGLFNHGKFQNPVFVSRRSQVRSQRLTRQFRQVEVKDDLQDLVHECDFLVIAVLPGQCEQVLSALEFRADQTIVSLVAGCKLEHLRKMVAPATRVHRAVPMPPIEFGLGTTCSREMFVPLSHAPGHAQVDFGEARAVIGGVARKVNFFALDLPHSDACFMVRDYRGRGRTLHRSPQATPHREADNEITLNKNGPSSVSDSPLPNGA